MEVCEVVRDIRINHEQTQLQFGFDYEVTRETISRIENGRQKVPMDISRKMMDKFDDPRLAWAIRHEYTGTGTRLLDGQNVDLHPASVKEKSLEEIQEAIDAMSAVSFAKPLHLNSPMVLENAAVQIVQAVIALEHLAAAVCSHGNLSYQGVWKKVDLMLEKAGYVK
ncbi:helix-turn-helix domain-containing protein [Lysinibacillus xylanilyticus]|uniref:helix-turn-helix domain-containing protein n=1 Tax=Lysinibacillus xylanilyticus TaxID=582475 RepID=UPI003CFF3C2D